MSEPSPAGRRTDGASLAGGLAMLVAGGALAGARLDGAPLPLGWALILCCVLAAVALRAGADPASGASSYAGVLERALEPRPRWTLIAARVAVVAAAPLAGAGPLAYATLALWQTARVRPLPALEWRRSAATALLGLAAVLTARRLGVRIVSDDVLWPILLAAAGLALLWCSATGRRGGLAEQASVCTLLGFLLTCGAAGLVLDATGLFSQAGRTIAGTAVAMVVLALVAGPRWWRTARLLAAERVVRARVEERAELSRHLHDSVLQTLALIQRRADDPAEVAGLARRQERDLRAWLNAGAHGLGPGTSIASALRAAAAAVEDDHGVNIEVVTVGDRKLDAAAADLVAAAREALANAARHGGGAPISLFAEIERARLAIYVRDRGPGFDTAAVPADRRGLRDSILARVQDRGGRATITSAPGEGCEVELVLEARP